MWKRADTQKLKSKIGEMSNNILEKFNINTLWYYFKTMCTDIMEECIPSKTTSTRITQPWITKDLRTLSRRKEKLPILLFSFCVSAFFHMYILRFTGFWLDIAMLESTKTISWSLMPGIASHLLINDARRKEKLYNQAKPTHKTRDWNSYNAIKKLAQKKCREAYSSYINNIICSDEASPKLFWNYIKNKKNDRCGCVP
jgi:hypothetical protein